MYCVLFTDNIEGSQKRKVVNLSTSSVSNDIVKAVATYGLIVQDVPHDGNCALHAVIDQLSVLMHPMNETITELRNKAVTFLRHNSIKLQVEQYLDKSEFINVDAYLSHQSRNGVRLDEPMMRALTEVLQKDIRIYHDNGHVTLLAPTVNSSDGSALQVCSIVVCLFCRLAGTRKGQGDSCNFDVLQYTPFPENASLFVRRFITQIFLSAPAKISAPWKR